MNNDLEHRNLVKLLNKRQESREMNEMENHAKPFFITIIVVCVIFVLSFVFGG